MNRPTPIRHLVIRLRDMVTAAALCLNGKGRLSWSAGLLCLQRLRSPVASAIPAPV